MSFDANTLRKLASLNLSSEQMAGVVDILADMQEAEETRKAAQRDRARKSRASRDRNVTATARGRDVPRGGVTRVEDKTSNLDIEPKKVEKKGKARATRLSPDWTLPPEWRDDAIAAGLSPERINAEADKMRDWSMSAPNGAKLEWRPSWRNWCRRAAEAPLARGSPVPKPRTTQDVARDLLRKMESADASPHEEIGRGPAPPLRLSSYG